MLKIYAIVTLLSLPVPIFSQVQVNDSIRKKRLSNEYIELYDDYIKIRLGVSNSFNSFHVKEGTDNLNFTLSPNQRIRTIATFTYKFIEFDIGYTPRFIRFNKDDEIKGKTTFYNLGTRLYLRNWMQHLLYSKTKGFYVDKNDIGNTENLLFPDFQVSKFGGSTSYIFNDNFSFRSIFSQSEWQKRSAGSFVPSISYYFTEIKNNNPSKDNVIDLAMGPSYYYNLVLHKNFLISGGAYVGLGYNSTRTKYSDGRADEHIDGLSLQSQIRFTIGFNSENIYMGATTSLNSFYYDTDSEIHVQDQQKFFEFYVGYRFKGPDKVNKYLDNPPIIGTKNKTIK